MHTNKYVRINRLGNSGTQIKTRKNCHPWLLDCRVHAADGLILDTAVPILPFKLVSKYWLAQL